MLFGLNVPHRRYYLKPHNTRSQAQWDIISRHVDFRSKTVLDLGCGKGDILACAIEAGASVIGLDYDRDNTEYIRQTLPGAGVINKDIDLFTAVNPMRYYTDIVICFSVLPYLKRPERALKWMNDHSKIALIECQYAGDGPGFSFLTGNDDMREWLVSAGQFEDVSPIGYTVVEGRNKKRYIWMCK